jgi:hypothetical protein
MAGRTRRGGFVLLPVSLRTAVPRGIIAVATGHRSASRFHAEGFPHAQGQRMYDDRGRDDKGRGSEQALHVGRLSYRSIVQERSAL